MFFFFALVVVMVALAIMLPGLFRRRPVSISGREMPNVRLARERIAELDRDLDSGDISLETYRELRDEVEAGLVEDIDGATGDAEAEVRGQWAAVVIAFAVPVLAAGIYLLIGTPGAVMPSLVPASMNTAQVPDASEVAGMIETLATRLEENPNDAEGWALLGRSYVATGQYDLGVDAYEKLLSLAGEHPLILVMLADALNMQSGGQISARSSDLVLRALELDPANPQALWMSGIAAIQNRDPDNAIMYWERLEPMLAESPEQQAEIQALIAQARQMQGAGSGEEPVETGPGDETGVTVSVEIDPGLAGEVGPEDTLFVYARAAEGPPMPLAVQRFTASDLPVETRLDDTDAMMPTMSISRFDSIVVGARISQSGNAVAEPGDIEGISAPVTPGPDVSVRVEINSVVE